MRYDTKSTLLILLHNFLATYYIDAFTKARCIGAEVASVDREDAVVSGFDVSSYSADAIYYLVGIVEHVVSIATHHEERDGLVCVALNLREWNACIPTAVGVLIVELCGWVGVVGKLVVYYNALAFVWISIATQARYVLEVLRTIGAYYGATLTFLTSCVYSVVRPSRDVIVDVGDKQTVAAVELRVPARVLTIFQEEILVGVLIVVDDERTSIVG